MSTGYHGMLSLLTYPVRPTNAQLAAGNLVFCALAAGSAPLIGSALAFLVAISAGWALLLLAGRRITWPHDRTIGIAALLFGLYFLAELAAGLINGPDRDTLAEVAENLIFLAPLPLYALLRADRHKLARVLPLGASIGSLVALAVAMTGLYGYDGQRLSLTCGNAGVLALVASVAYGLSLTGAGMETGGRRAAYLAGAAAGAALVVMTGMRVFWPVIALLPVFVLFVLIRSRKTAILAGLGLATLLTLGAFAAFQSMPLVQARIDAAISDLENIEDGEMDNSIGLRIVMWRTAADLIAEKPLLGHGPGHVGDRMGERLSVNGKPVTFTHYHNFALTAAVRSGITGALILTAAILVLPLAALRHALKTGDRLPLARAGALAIPYLASGLTGPMFGHDILDALYFALLPVLLYLQASTCGSDQSALEPAAPR